MNQHLSDHLSDDELLARLYGLEPYPHADSCAECAARYRRLELRRKELAAPAEISQEKLIAQRRRVLARIEEGSGWGRKWVWKWAPAGAAACALAIGLFVFRAAPVPAPAPAAHMDSADAQLFSEVYQMEEATEPRAAAPIHALFDDNP